IEFPKDALKAENTIHHNRIHTSRIIAPALPQFVNAVSAQPASLRYVDSEPTSSAAVIVGDIPLIHTSQLLPVNEMGRVMHAGDPVAQFGQVLDRLDGLLRQGASGLDRVVKLNVYFARYEISAPIQQAIAARYSPKRLPALSLVTTALP